MSLRSSDYTALHIKSIFIHIDKYMPRFQISLCTNSHSHMQTSRQHSTEIELEEEEDAMDMTRHFRGQRVSRFLEEYLVSCHGSKIGHVVMYLRRIWMNDPSSKVIVFSQVQLRAIKITKRTRIHYHKYNLIIVNILYIIY